VHPRPVEAAPSGFRRSGTLQALWLTPEPSAPTIQNVWQIPPVLLRLALLSSRLFLLEDLFQQLFQFLSEGHRWLCPGHWCNPALGVRFGARVPRVWLSRRRAKPTLKHNWIEHPLSSWSRRLICTRHSTLARQADPMPRRKPISFGNLPCPDRSHLRLLERDCSEAIFSALS
jgi:hypothetical protein